MSTLLPQKWLMSLLTLLLFCIGSGSAWAQDSEFGFVQTMNGSTLDNPRWTTIDGVTNSGELHGSLTGYYENKESKNFRWNGNADTGATYYWRTGSEGQTDFNDDQWVGYTLTVENGKSLDLSHITAQILSETVKLYYKVKILDASDKVLYESDRQECQNWASGQIIREDFTLNNLAGDVKVRLYVYADNSGTTKYYTVNNLQVKGSLHTFDYSVVAKYNNKTQTLASGSSLTDVTVYYPRYILDGTTLYGIARNGSDPWFGTTVTAAAPSKELNYTQTINDVVFYVEGEKINGFDSANSLNRASEGHMGYTKGKDDYKNTTTLNIGKYKIYSCGHNGNSATRTCNFKVGSTVVYGFSIPNGNNHQGSSDEFEVNSNNTQLSVACEGSSISGLDYFYIVKTGDLTPEVTLASAASQTINTSQTLSLGVNTKNVSFTTLDLYSDAAHTNKLGFVGYNNPYTFNPAEGVKKGDDPNNGEVLKSGEGTYYFVFTGINSNGSNGWIETKVSYTVEVTAPEVTYELNGGQCDRMTDPLNQEVTLPKPTKAGYSFIGWMNASNEVTPTAGYAGDKKTYNTATTLYALWYKNNCEIDFTTTGPIAPGTGDKTGVVFRTSAGSIVNGKSFSAVTIGTHDVNNRFVLEPNTTWLWRTSGNLYSMNGSARSFGVANCVNGDYIIIESDKNPNVRNNATLVNNNGNTWIYKVTADGGVEFRPDRYINIKTITVSSACVHNIWYEENGGQVGPEDLSANWWTNFSQFYHITKGETLNFKFTNHTNKAISYNNWVFIAQANTQHNGDLGFSSTADERLIVRADGWSWGTNCGNPLDMSFKRFANETDYKNGTMQTWVEQPKQEGFNEETGLHFMEDMDDAEVTVNVDFNEWGTLTVTAVTKCTDGHVYEMKKSSTNFTEEELYFLFTVEHAYLTGMSHPIIFRNPTDAVVITGNGTAVYEQKAVGNPEGTWVRYSVGETTGTAQATVTQIEGSNEYQLTVSGRGTVQIIATCGGETATCTLTVDGIYFNEPAPVIAHHIYTYDAELNIEDPEGVNFSIVDFDSNIQGATVEKVTYTENGQNKVKAHITLPNGTEGGVVVVRATKGDAKAELCLTAAYDKYVWDLYNDPLSYGTVADGDKVGSRPGSAHYVIFEEGGDYTYEGKTVTEVYDEEVGEYVDVETYGTKTDKNRVAYNDWKDGQNYYAKEDWYNAQTGTKTQGSITKNYDLLHKNWKFTYKTCTYKDGKRTYVNEPLFAYTRPVVGDNARIVKDTQGLWFKAEPIAWGVSDNDITDAEGANKDIREADRCILMKKGTSLTVPFVKAGRYVRVHWYRHSTDNGDAFQVKNAMDLDGKIINPEHRLRFTGSHYYGHKDNPDDTGVYGHKGSTIFYVPTVAELDGKTDDEKCGMFQFTKDGDGDDCVDLVLTISKMYDNQTDWQWTEVYRVEIMDKYMTELQLCQVDCYPETGTQGGTQYTHRATIDTYNAHDINVPSYYNETDHNKIAAKLASRVKTLQATGDHPKEPTNILPAPSLYINGYAGNCYTWNGWQNMALVAENVDGSTSLSFETAREEVAVGNRITYPMYKLFNVRGSGAIKLTLKCLSGDINASEENEPRYCLNKQEAYVAAGEYSVQVYPYTWDFTKYNMDRGSLAYPEHIGSPMLSNITNSGFNRANAYGRWENKTGNGEIAGLHAAEKQTVTWGKKQSILNADSYKGQDQPVIGGTSGTIKHIIREQDIRNKRYFAQTSQLTISDGNYRVISETEGLRMSMSAIDDGSNLNKIYFKGVAANGDETKDANPNGYKGKWNNTSLYVDGTITIPEVYEGMYVYIRSPKKPKSVTGAVDYNRRSPDENREVNSVPVDFYDDNANVKHMSNDIPDGVWVYKVEAGEKKIDLYTGELKSDGEPVSDVVVTLSDEDKTVEAIGVTWFFKPMTQMASNTNDYSTFSTDSRGERIDYNNTKLFTKHHLQAQISTGNVVIDDKTYGENGVLGMKNIAVVPAADDVDNFAGVTRGLLLEDIVENRDASITKRPLLPLFVPACNLADQSLDGNCLIAADGDYVEASPKGSQYMNYVFTTQSYSYNWNEGGALTDLTIKDAAFYILRESGNLRKNSAYLKIARPANNANGVKQIILVKGEVEEGDATSIETIGTDAEIADLEGADVYTVTGIKVAKPTKKGVYVVNGKKVYVK